MQTNMTPTPASSHYTSALGRPTLVQASKEVITKGDAILHIKEKIVNELIVPKEHFQTYFRA